MAELGDPFETIGDFFEKVNDVERIILFESCQDGDLREIKHWFEVTNIDKKDIIEVSLRLRNFELQTLLHVAALYGRACLVKYLIEYYKEYQININTLLDKHSNSPFHLACSRGFPQSMKTEHKLDAGYDRTERYYILLSLLDNGATINLKALTSRKANSPLHWCIYHGDFASSLLVFLLDPYQVFYKNEQDQVPFDVIHGYIVNRHYRRTQDGLWIIEHLLLLMRDWLRKYSLELNDLKDKTKSNIQKLRVGFSETKDGKILKDPAEIAQYNIDQLISPVADEFGGSRL
jgi:hypothetical protein